MAGLRFGIARAGVYIENMRADVLVTTMQVENMTQKHHVYMTKDGRISLAGAPPATFPNFCAQS